MNIMKHPLSFVGGLLTGALAMYYLDARSGSRRRALVRHKVVSAGHDLSSMAGAKSKRAMGRIKGMLVTRRLDRVSHSHPQSDEQLHDRIRSRLGRMVHYPKAVEIEVAKGRVRIHGHVLRREVSDLCREVQNMAGVRELHTELQVHHKPEEISQLYSHSRPEQQVQRPPVQAVH
jgi:hyperosmotically inducible periplasmic protein